MTVMIFLSEILNEATRIFGRNSASTYVDDSSSENMSRACYLTHLNHIVTEPLTDGTGIWRGQLKPCKETVYQAYLLSRGPGVKV